MISIIVPVYNSELYLAECLESIKNQTYKDFEVVLYNDGSTDNSKNICERFLHEDSRFKYYEQENQGPGTTRNNALKKASGDYICFVDSDDIVSEYYLERLYDAIVETDAEISACDLTRVSPSYFKITDNTPLILNKEEAITELIQERKLRNYSYCRLIKKEKIQNISFDTTKNEDVFFSLRLFKNINKTVVIDDKLYFYRINNQSITNQNNFEFEFNVLENYLKCNEILDNEEQIKINKKKIFNYAFRLYDKFYWQQKNNPLLISILREYTSYSDNKKFIFFVKHPQIYKIYKTVQKIYRKIRYKD